MANKKNPFDDPLPPEADEPIRPDADIRNADWCKRHGDIDAYTGKPVKPIAVPFEKRHDADGE